MIISIGKFKGAPIGAVPDEDLGLVALEARRTRNRTLLRAVETEIQRRRRRREQTRLLRKRYPRSSA